MGDFDYGSDVDYREEVKDSDYYEDYDSEEPFMSAGDIYSQCLEPVGLEAFHHVIWVLTSCLLLRLLNHHCKWLIIPEVDKMAC